MFSNDIIYEIAKNSYDFNTCVNLRRINKCFYKASQVSKYKDLLNEKYKDAEEFVSNLLAIFMYDTIIENNIIENNIVEKACSIMYHNEYSGDFISYHYNYYLRKFYRITASHPTNLFVDYRQKLNLTRDQAIEEFKYVINNGFIRIKYIISNKIRFKLDLYYKWWFYRACEAFDYINICNFTHFNPVLRCKTVGVRVHLIKGGKNIDVTHQPGVPYTLSAKDLEGEGYVIHSEDGPITLGEHEIPSFD